MRPAALGSCLLLAALAIAALPAPAIAQPAPGNATAGVRVQVFVDERRNAAARRQHIGYRLRPGPGALELRPESDELMRRWKGDTVLGQGPRLDLGPGTSAWPAFLVLDLSNESTRALQVTQAFLEVDSSATDAQPYLEFSSRGLEAFTLRNLGWGTAENAVLRFAFGPETGLSEPYTLELGTLGAVRVNPERAMASLVPALAQLREKAPPCPSFQQVSDCLAQLHRSAALGRLGDIAVVRRDRVMTRLSGTLSYQWRDAEGVPQTRSQALQTELQLFRFEVPEPGAAGIGAPGPEQEGYAPVALQLDRSRYRLSLPYRPRLGPGENQRFQLALSAPQASRHRLRVVVEYEGRRATGEPIDLLYFVPKADPGEPRLVR